MKVDKQNGDVVFVEGSHKYYNVKDPNMNYISVTTLINKYCQPFDSNFWSAYKALEKLLPKDSWDLEKKSLLSSKKFDKKLLTIHDIKEDEFNAVQQSILDEWQKSNRDSCERGTKIHSEIENSFYSKPKDIDLQRFGIGGKFECRKGYTTLDLDSGVYPEYLIHWETKDGILCLAGQIDLLVKDGNDLYLADHKTNSKIDRKPVYDPTSRKIVTMKYPLTNLPDLNYYHYSMQLSLYAYMLERLNPDFKIQKLIINHYDHDGNNRLYHCEYLKRECEKLLMHYKQQVILANKRKSRNKIEY